MYNNTTEKSITSFIKIYKHRKKKLEELAVKRDMYVIEKI